MNQTNPQAARDIHLLTTDALLADLVDGREVIVTGGTLFCLKTDDSRSVLDWYRQNASKWAGNLSGVDIEAIIDAAGEQPPAIKNDGSAAKRAHVRRTLRLAKLTAHRFAGLHAYGSPTEIPEVFTFVPSKDATLFEGANGSGKTSILNAILVPDGRNNPLSTRSRTGYNRIHLRDNAARWQCDYARHVFCHADAAREQRAAGRWTANSSGYMGRVDICG